MTKLPVALALAIAMHATPALAADVITRVSDAPPTPPDRAWQEAGFRAELFAGYDRIDGFGAAPGGDSLMFGLQPGVMLSSWLSLDAALRYALYLGGTTTGMRWDITFGTTFHPAPGLGLTVALGYAGTRSNFRLESAPTVQSYCVGAGGALQGRISYLIPVMEGFATGPTLEGGILGIQCGDNVNGVDASGNTTSGYIPFWWQHSVSLSWAAAWR